MTLADIVASYCLWMPAMCAPPPSEVVVAPPTGNSRVPVTVQDVPLKARKWTELLKQISNNPSREGALTEQESNWNERARSPYAKGLRQFTDSTGKWASKTFCRDLGTYRPYDPDWSLRCGVRYVERLHSNNRYSGGYCFNRFVAEQEYNGGSWIIRELRRAGSDNLTSARLQCRRASWACKENYEYPQQINRRQPKYSSMGGTLCQ